VFRSHKSSKDNHGKKNSNPQKKIVPTKKSQLSKKDAFFSKCYIFRIKQTSNKPKLFRKIPFIVRQFVEVCDVLDYSGFKAINGRIMAEL
jgi:hypothetical protein